MIRLLIADWMLRPGVGRDDRLRAAFQAAAPSYDGALLQAAATDFQGFTGAQSDDLAFGLSCLAAGAPVHLGIFPADNAMTPGDYAAVVAAAVAQVEAAGKVVHGARLTWRIPSVVPAGCAFGLETPGSIPQAQLLAECSEMAGRFAAAGWLASFPIYQPGAAWGDGSEAFSASLRTTARYMLSDRCVVGQLSWPDAYEAGGAILSAPPCFAQLAVDTDPVAATARAEAMGLLWLEYHRGAQAAPA